MLTMLFVFRVIASIVVYPGYVADANPDHTVIVTETTVVTFN